jgi:hypothetical protein
MTETKYCRLLATLAYIWMQWIRCDNR